MRKTSRPLYFCLLLALVLLIDMPHRAVAEVKKADDTPQPFSPEESVKMFQLPDGFRMELVAAEPLVSEPVCTAFDEKGRLFVAELHGYNYEGHLDIVDLNKTGKLDRTVRRIQASDEHKRLAKEFQHGVVKLLEDTDGDGRMDKATVWANDLEPCYGIIPARDGIIATAAPQIVYLADRDGDGEVDHREVLFDGFGVHLLERAINNPRWGKDNWIYAGAGGGGGTIRGPNLAKPVTLGNTDFRFKADGSAIEPVSGTVGTYGLALNDLGDRFPCSGGQPAIYSVPVDYRYLRRNPFVPGPRTTHSAVGYNRCYRISEPHPWRVKRGSDPNWQKFYGEHETNSSYFTGGCGNDFYRAALFPKEYYGNFMMCEPSQNILHRCIVNREGSAYRGHRPEGLEEAEFVASTDQWFRPVNVRVGPDGALYVSDMYREIIEDYSAIPRFLQQQYGVANGDEYGRIWRLVPEGKPLRPLVDMSKLSSAELVPYLADSDSWWRETAQRVLVRRGDKSVAPAVAKLVAKGKSAQARIHALHTLAGLGELGAEEVTAALADDDFSVRVHALRTCEPLLADNPGLLTKVCAMTGDVDARVRLQLAMTLGEAASEQATSALFRLAKNHGAERWMSNAVLSSCNENAGELLAMLAEGEDPTEGARKVIRPLAQTIGGQRDGKRIGILLKTVVASVPDVQSQAIRGLVDGLSDGDVSGALTPDGRRAVVALLEQAAPRIRAESVKLAAILLTPEAPELKRAFEEATALALDDSAELARRVEAIALLANASYDVFAPTVQQLLDVRQLTEVKLATVNALSQSDNAAVTKALLEGWEGYTPKVREATLDAIFARADRVPELLTALEQGRVSRVDINAFRRERLLKARYAIRTRAQKIFDQAGEDGPPAELVTQYQEALDGPRDVARGKTLATKHCLVCHQLGAEGHKVGPNFAEIANQPDDALLQEILAPSRKIDPQYRNYVVTTKDGRQFNGVMVSESANSVTLAQQEGKQTTILLKDFDEEDSLRASDVSLMPADLYKQVEPKDLADILGFLRATLAGAKKDEGK
ncbi:MAG: hypothetical protein DWQ31_15725 [Planctomycetota bacterium]|nr:MAG: hypothetical protein DWQ31_15725 [Planctomycetota bacterium]REJ97390.1 MAG: hypothetical protein DWQ35_02200 [Planctomycetota bacterium]REK27699.1 MAG: hypothetical protein DWQ42_06970 [Planctomycetota bacterium]REK38459.1 MAG: hypothetical protein DWQ46_20215 [Planctomycetota bacterium]